MTTPIENNEAGRPSGAATGSVTPRTDANIAGWNALPKLATSQEIVTANFARELETEIGEMAHYAECWRQMSLRLADALATHVQLEGCDGCRKLLAEFASLNSPNRVWM